MKRSTFLLLLTCVLYGRSVDAQVYFVNDGSTANDVFTTAIGNDANSGLASNLPKRTITNLLASYILAPGAVVYIDTGVYSNYTVTIRDSGSSASPIVFQGSTNLISGGTILDRNSSLSDVIVLSTARHVVLRDLRVRGGFAGVLSATSTSNDFERVLSIGNTYGFRGTSSSFQRYSRCVAYTNVFGLDATGGGTYIWDSGILWSNGTALRNAAQLFVSNSVIVGGTALSGTLPASLDSTLFWQSTLATGYDFLGDLEVVTSAYRRLTWADPAVANPAALDFHPLSVVGRFDPATSSRVTDAVHSVLIDMGDPARVFTNEPAPNGTAIDAGIHGNSAVASLSRTSAWLFAMTFNDGGTFASTGALWWSYGAFTNGSTVRIQYSTNAGLNWLTLASGIPVTNRTFTWSVTSLVSSLAGRWRVQDEGVTGVADACDRDFAIRASPSVTFTAFVNDASTSNDVYTTAPGATSNLGITRAQPRLTLQSVLDDYDFGPGDVIYVDTGLYTNTTTIGVSDGGNSSARVFLRGSTNLPAGGSRIQVPGGFGIIIANASFLDIAGFTIEGCSFGMDFVSSASNVLTSINIISNSATGVRAASVSATRFANMLFARNNLGASIGSLGNQMDYSTFWGNSNAMTITAGALTLSNTILAASALAFTGSSLPVSSDYLLFWNIGIGGGYNNVYDYQRTINGSWRSTFADPLFQAPEALDFGLRSIGGRFSFSTGTFVTDAVHSIAIDLGDPAHPVDAETSPNGGRRNSGNFGGTIYASRSRTNAYLEALSLRDGGQLTIGDPVYWSSGNLPTGSTVRIEFSGDGGVGWQVVASNLLASAGSYSWANTNFASSSLARWRVVYEAAPSVLSASPTNFVFRNGPFPYYINDASLAGDVFCFAPGDDLNAGTTPSSPKASLTNLLATVDLEPGDVVYVDTGLYRPAATPTLTASDSGSATNPVVFRFSTNEAAGGAVLSRSILQLDALQFSGASHVEIRDAIFATNLLVNVRIDNSTGIVLRGLSLPQSIDTGVRVSGSASTVVDRCVLYEHRSNGVLVVGNSSLAISRSVFWRNGRAGVAADAGRASVSGSVIVASGADAFVYRAATATNVVGNFNGYFAVSNAAFAQIVSLQRFVDNLGAWQQSTGQDRDSLETDPLFANPVAFDFHLRTETPEGRFDPGSGLWVSDSATSPLIDAGDPGATFTNETAPNGSRVNIGLFGNTAFASRGRTTPWIYAATFEQGGWARGTVTLHWVSGNLPTSSLVRVEYSPNAGESWSVLSTGTPIQAETYTWSTLTTNDTWAGLWRVTSLANTNVTDQNGRVFAIRNNAMALYINDSSVANDVFSLGPGAATNLVGTLTRPYHSLAMAMQTFDIEPGDRIYVDTGVYSEGQAVPLFRPDGGLATNPVVILGPTNGRIARIERGSTIGGAHAIDIVATAGLSLSNLVFAGGHVGVNVLESRDLLLSVSATANSSNGWRIQSSSNVVLRRAVSAFNGGSGLVLLTNLAFTADSSIVWSNGLSAIVSRSGALSVSNSVLLATGAGRYVYDIGSTGDVFRADFNNIVAVDGAQVALSGPRALKFLSNVRDTLGVERRSLSHDPLFVDPAAGDWNVRSEAGRFSPGGAIVTDLVTSVLIDAGDPGRPVGAEPLPNGSRVNIGLQGAAAEAGRTPTNARLTVVSFNDGGVVRGTNSLAWVATGGATGHTLTLQFSANGGATWTNIATNINAAAGELNGWDTSPYGSTAFGLWRIISENDPSVADTNDLPFTVNNGSISYFVNDASTNGDVYATAPGSSLNDGLLPATPAASIAEILSRYSVSPGDRIFVDAGSYVLTQPVAFDPGTIAPATNAIVIAGSTNPAALTVLTGAGLTEAFLLESVAGVTLRDLHIRSSRVGVRITSSTNVFLEGLTVMNPQFNAGGGYGIDARIAPNLVIRRCAVAGITNNPNVGAGIRIRETVGALISQSVLWSNLVNLELTSAQATISNSSFSTFAPQGFSYLLDPLSSVSANYNNYEARNGSRIARIAGYLAGLSQPSLLSFAYIDDLVTWVRQTGNDRFSLSHDPLFADPGAGDFRLLSAGGRFVPGTGIVTDAVSSLLIDAGGPSDAFAAEPPPNGGRLNIGTFGNTPEASLTPVSTSRLTVVSLNDRGIASGTTQLLYWIASGPVTGHMLRVDISRDDGFAWDPLVTNIPAGTTSVLWNTTTWPTQPFYRWRILSEVDGTVFDVADAWFMVRNSNMTYFVNDGVTNGDVFTTAPGFELGTGLLPSSPENSLQDVLQLYDIEPGDRIYVDSGEYSSVQTVSVSTADSGAGTNWVQIIGSTNRAAPTRFSGAGFLVEGANSVRFSDIELDVSGASRSHGYLTANSSNIVLESSAVSGSAGHGVWVRTSRDIVIDRTSIVGALTNGVFDDFAYATLIQNAVLWSNRFGIRAQGIPGAASQLRITNSVFGALNSLQVPFVVGAAGAVTSDYNAIFVTNGAVVANVFTETRPIIPLQIASVAQWARDTGRDQRSLAVDPLFAGAPTNFRLRSAAGRWDPSVTGFVNDAVTSPLIDAGDPTYPWTNEPPVNGGRINMGRYGNTWEASRSPTNPSLIAVSLNDGGIASPVQTLYWLARGAATGMAVRVELSTDNGATWTPIASGLPPGTSSVSWNSTGAVSSVLAQWRVVSESNTNVFDGSDRPFAIRNGPIPFYVNDATTTGDVYTTQAGQPTNLGTAPSSPLDSLSRVLDLYDLEPGDVVYIDTGRYTNAPTIIVGQLDSGNTNGPFVVFQGSTNDVAGGTLFLGVGAAPAVEFSDARGIHARNLRVQASDVNDSISIQNSSALLFEGVETFGGRNGYLVSSSRDIRWMNSLSRNHSGAGVSAAQLTAGRWELGVLWSNTTAAQISGSGDLSVSNSVMGAFGAGNVLYRADHLSTVGGDFNALFVTNGALYAELSVDPVLLSIPRQWEVLARWARDTGFDRFSMAVDPQFADASAGNFYLKSQAGRYDPITGSFTNDPETSPLIDAASPFLTVSNELAPNGGRANIGMHGNTARASRTPTNALLQVVSLRDGGRVEGSSVPLYWLARGAATGDTVRVEYAISTANVWIAIATGVPARLVSPVVFWDTTAATSTISAAWRVVSETDASLAATNASRFAIRNEPLRFYLNDAGTAGDQYSTAPGSALNDGTAPDRPINSLQAVLDRYDLDPGDFVYVDTGAYVLNADTVRWGRFDAWDNTQNLAPLAAGGVSVTLMGSTNPAGSIFVSLQTPETLVFTQALGVAVRRIGVRQLSVGEGVGISFVGCQYAVGEWLDVQDGFLGISANQSRGIVFSNSMARGHADAGFRVRASDGARWVSGVLWSNRFGLYQADDLATPTAQVTIENSILGAFGSNTFAIVKASGVLNSDYNNIFRSTSAFAGGVLEAGILGGGTTRYESVTSWFNATGDDRHSLATDPRFAGPGDFHLRSPAGRFVTGVGYITNAAEPFSPLIDSGRPTSPFDRETIPNGGRIDIGLYGNTPESSLSPSNGQLSTITFNDGGSSEGVIELRWAASGAVTGHLGTLQFSSNGGATWTNIATNVALSTRTYTWDSVPYGRAAAALWRIFSQVDGTLIDVSDTFFALRNGGSIPYYVNDASTNGDVYTSAPGNDGNNGFLPSTPKATIQGLLNAIDLEPGDIVYIDTGSYPISQEIIIGDLDAGSPTNAVILQGSTNLAAGGSVVDRQTGLGNAIRVFETQGISIRDLKVVNGGNGVVLDSADFCSLIRVRSESHSDSAFRATECGPSNFFFNCLAALSSNGVNSALGTLNWRNGVVWGNQNPVFLGNSGSIDVRGSVLRAVGPTRRIFNVSQFGGTITGDYNNYFREEGALMYERTDPQFGRNELISRLAEWQEFSGQDAKSHTLDPLLWNPSAGDYHPRSATGRYFDSGVLTNDADGIFSPLIDTGDPLVAWTNETAPNGGRINMGMFGNTPLASRSQTNPWLLALTYNDGGVIRGTVTVHWAAGGMTNGTLVRLERALDGVDFVPFASNISAQAGSHPWDVSSLPLSPFARWRVVCQGCGASDENNSPITIKNQNLVLYVNDGSTVGDLYTSVPGAATNTGGAPNSPLNDPDLLLQRYELGPGDTVYIDTGSYSLTNAAGMVVGLVGSVLEKGEPGNPIRIIGSTNVTAGGSVIYGIASSNAPVLRLVETRYVEISGLTLEGGGFGVRVEASPFVTLRDIRAQKNLSAGAYVFRSNPVELDRVLLWTNSTYGLDVLDLAAVSMDRSVIWDNGVGGARLASVATLAASNSILQAARTNQYITTVQDVSSFSGNYNLYWPANGSFIGRDGLRTLNLRTLTDWQNAWGSDSQSMVFDPDFADPSNGVFYLKSQSGRYDPTLPGFVADAASSWAIDAADPTRSVGAETAPNGGRMNLGLYGGTPFASRTVTNPAQRALRVISFDDGGQMTQPTPMRWFARGFATNELVYLEFSIDDGLTWRPMATNLSATQGSYSWSPDPTNSSPVTRWRVISQANPAIFSTNQAYFALRLRPVTFYVNDASTAGDVYTDAPGSDANTGLSKDDPALSIQYIFDRYDLEGGDQVLMDTGYYTVTQSVITAVATTSGVIFVTNFVPSGISLAADDNGLSTNPVFITGSTNWQAGGSVLDRQSTNLGVSAAIDAGILLNNGSRNYDISHLSIIRANNGIYGNTVNNLMISNVVVRDGGLSGVNLSIGQNTILERMLVTRMMGFGLDIAAYGPVTLRNSIVWSNAASAVRASSANVIFSNNVLHAHTTNYAYQFALTTNIVANYNNLFTEGLSRPASFDGLDIEGLPQWNALSGQDFHSIADDPLFADPTNLNFHERSPSGRFNPVTQSFIVTNEAFSPIVDAGNPADSFTNELAPNGGRRNIGLYGGTDRASKGRTNAWIRAITGSSGGRAADSFFLAWSYGNLDSTNTLRLDFSYDAGTNWVNITTNRLVSSLQYFWNTELQPLAKSPITKWRVIVESNTNIWDETDRTFALNGPFEFFVNDNSTAGDIFTTTAGSSNNLGIFAALPKSSLRDVLETWDIDGNDIIYIDTGNYLFSTNDVANLVDSDAGAAGAVVRIVGSQTNGGVSFIWNEVTPPPNLLTLRGTFLDVSGIRFAGGGIETFGTNIVVQALILSNAVNSFGGQFTTISNVFVDGGLVRATGRDQELVRVTVRNGDLQLQGRDLTMRNSTTYGTQVVAATVSGTNIALRNNTIVGRRNAIVVAGGDSSLDLRNNILIADGSLGEAYVVRVESGSFVSDYNNLVARNGAWFGNSSGTWERLIYWQRNSGKDQNSISAEPLFADEVNADFRVRSVVGRWTPTGFVADVVHSPTIDMGAPGSDFSFETSPNGGRVNIGADGNTPEASLSRTGPWLLAMTANDGGVLRGTNTLRWASGNLAGGTPVTLRYSGDGGATWTNFAVGISVGLGEYVWDSSGITNSSYRSLWGIVLDSDTNVFDWTDSFFALRNGPLRFYVNDTQTLHDVYTTAPGHPTNDGLTVSTPRESLQGLLAAYDVEGGDVIYVDTGIYPSTNNVRVIWSRGGSDTNQPLWIWGSTNFAAGGTVMARNSAALGDVGLDVKASDVRVRNLTIRGAHTGVLVDSNRNVTVERLNLFSNQQAVVLNRAFRPQVRNNIIRHSATGGVEVIGSFSNQIENNTFHANWPYSIRVETGAVATILQNNIFSLSVSGSLAYAGVLDQAFVDYNVYFFQTNAVGIATSSIPGSLIVTNLLPWQLATGRDFRSATTNPLFASVISNDFHLQSTVGRWVDGFGWTNDAFDSWAIDRGASNLVYDLEPLPNGARINIGAYGNTEFASRGRTNSQVLVETRTLNTFTRINETNAIWPLIWTVINVPTTELFRVEYSGDNGASWYIISNNVPAYQEYVIWNSSPFFNTFRGRWRIVGVNNTNFWDINDVPFEVFYGQFRITSVLELLQTNAIVWRGAWNEHYQVQWTTNPVSSNGWVNARSNAAPNQSSRFLSTNGGDFLYYDAESVTNRTRLYRVLNLQF